MGRQNHIEDPDGAAAPTLYSYDAAGRLTDVNQSGRTRHFGYGTTGWLSSATNPESGNISYQYTPAGRLLKRTDGRGVIFCQGALNGSACTANFDGAGRPLSASRRNGAQPVNVATYAYQFEQLQQVANSAASVEYGYDLLGRVQLRSQTVDGTPYQASVTAWKPAGPATMLLPSGRTLTFVYDGVGRVKSLSGTKDSQQRQYVTNAAWTAHGALKLLPLGNTLTETWSWNYRLQPVSVTAGAVFSLGYAYCSGGAVVCATNNGNLVEQTIGHANLKQSYTYDGFGRLHSASERATGAPPPDAWRHRYDYDVWGNRWVTAEMGPALDPFTPQSSGWYDANNRLTGAPSAAYDAARNQTQIGGYTFSYDEENRVKTSTINGQVTTYYYDGEGRRVKKVTPARTVVYAYGIDGEVAAEYDTNPQGGGAGVEYVLVDHLGSTRTLTDGTGAVTRREDYEPFGETLWAGMAGRGAPPHQAPPDAGQTGPRFTGTERDAETGLDYFGARYFSGAQGRWTSPDLINLTTARLVHPSNTVNKYVYAANSPLKYVDKDGEDITIFYRPPGLSPFDFGHVFLGVLNQNTGQVGFLDYWARNGRDGPGEFNVGNMQDRATTSSQFLTLTIQTTPEVAQRVLDAITKLTSASAPDYDFISNNCTSVVQAVLHDLGLDFGDVFPRDYWVHSYRHSLAVQQNPFKAFFVPYKPGAEYGNPRDVGMDFTRLLFQVYVNQWIEQQHQQKPPKACVEAHDDKGNSTGTTCTN